jgi:hypothetical protein
VLLLEKFPPFYGTQRLGPYKEKQNPSNGVKFFSSTGDKMGRDIITNGFFIFINL